MEEAQIIVVSHFPVLYNTALKEYQLNIRREAAWIAVSLHTGTDGIF